MGMLAFTLSQLVMVFINSQSVMVLKSQSVMASTTSDIFGGAST